MLLNSRIGHKASTGDKGDLGMEAGVGGQVNLLEGGAPAIVERNGDVAFPSKISVLAGSTDIGRHFGLVRVWRDSTVSTDRHSWLPLYQSRITASAQSRTERGVDWWEWRK